MGYTGWGDPVLYASQISGMNAFRQFAERFSRGKVFRRRLPAKYGGAQFYVTPECGLRYLRRNLESVDPTLLNLAREFVKPGAVVWDIGANLGLFSFASAGLAGPAGKIFAVEPDTYLVGLLRRSSRLRNDHAAPVSVIPCAASETLSLAVFNIAQRARASNFLSGHGQSQDGGVRESQRVVTVTLDWLATQIAKPDLIKIDAEGADFQVLLGGSQLLREQPPILIFEGSDAFAEAAAAFLLDLGFTLFDADLPPQLRRPLSRVVWSTLAIPGHNAQMYAVEWSGARQRQPDRDID
jgi:FkbM family methyltransferase